MSNPFHCVDFNQYKEILAILQRLDDVVMYCSISYQISRYGFEVDEKRVVARNLIEVAGYIGCKEKAASRSIQRIEAKRGIEVEHGMYKGMKSMYFHSTSSGHAINGAKFRFLTKITNCIYESFILAYCGYVKDEKLEASIDISEMSKLICKTKKTVKNIISRMESKGYMMSKFDNVGNYSCRVLCINESFYNRVLGVWEAPRVEKLTAQVEIWDVQVEKLTAQVEKRVVPNHIDNKKISEGYLKDRAQDKVKKYTSKKLENRSDESHEISFNRLDVDEMEGYVRTSINKTICQHKVVCDDVELLIKKVMFELPRSAERLEGVPHAVNAMMKMISNKTWRTPYGFEKYDEHGRRYRERLNALTNRGEKSDEEEHENVAENGGSEEKKEEADSIPRHGEDTVHSETFTVGPTQMKGSGVKDASCLLNGLLRRCGTFG